MPPFCAFSILPDGSLESIRPDLLDGLDGGDIVILDSVSLDGHVDNLEPATQEYLDLLLVHDNAAGDYFFQDEQFPTVSHVVEVQARYLRMRIRGESHAMAEMLAVRKFPALRTDATFNHGRMNGNQFEHCQVRGDWYRKRAEEAGVSTTGKYYSSGLARFPGDPKAWISDRGDVMRVAKENGMNVSGAVNYAPPEREPEAAVPIAPEILRSEVDQYMALGGGERRADVEERFLSVLTGAVDDHPLRVKD